MLGPMTRTEIRKARGQQEEGGENEERDDSANDAAKK
jgi:hypothetical protein